MVKRSLSKGFSLLESLIVLFLISSFTLMSFNNKSFDDTKWEHILFLSEFGKTQNIAMVNKCEEYFDYDDLYTLEDIYFNGKSNINVSQTIEFKDKDYILILGAGRIYEKDE